MVVLSGKTQNLDYTLAKDIYTIKSENTLINFLDVQRTVIVVSRKEIMGGIFSVSQSKRVFPWTENGMDFSPTEFHLSKCRYRFFSTMTRSLGATSYK